MRLANQQLADEVFITREKINKQYFSDIFFVKKNDFFFRHYKKKTTIYFIETFLFSKNIFLNTFHGKKKKI